MVEIRRQSAALRSKEAAVIAALIGNTDVGAVIKEASELFRCVSWDVLKQHPEIIIEGKTLDLAGAGSGDLNSLSHSCVDLSFCNLNLSLRIDLCKTFTI